MQFLRRPRLAVSSLLLAHFFVLFAGVVATELPEEQHRMLIFAPPIRIHFFDENHRFHWRPFVYPLVLKAGTFNQYQEEKTRVFPISFFQIGPPYKLLGIFPARRHVLVTSPPAHLFFLGTDGYGRDQFSRLLYGGRISLFAGLLASSISISLGLIIGALAGFYGGWLDSIIMRFVDAFLAVPWLYLLLATRAILPLHVEPSLVFLLVILVLGAVGWARPARLIRGIALTAKEREYVTAALGFGASDLYLLRKHVLPFASPVALTQWALYVPQYILAEVILSFFGLGVSEPEPSWGNMLTPLQQMFVVNSCWWMFAPAVAITAVSFAYQRLFDYYSTRLPAAGFIKL
jgi:peptide/nickel transport system permease protein